MRFLLATLLTLNTCSLLIAADPAPAVDTRGASALGTTGASLDGSIHPHGLFTTWHFEYGPTAAYGSKTPDAVLPPRLAAFYRETWDENPGNWFSWGKLEHVKEGGAARGFIRCPEPTRDDHNHDESVGTVHLNKYFYPGRLNLQKTSAYLGGGDPDFRDAKISVSVRGNQFVANGAELAWWSQSQSNIEKLVDDYTLNADYRHANWAYSGHNLTDLLQSGKWEKTEYRLRNEMAAWSYAGSSQGRYTYWPITETQRHLNLDFFHMLIGVDVKNPPQGSIDYDEFEVAYRNHSLLIPSNGGKLVSAPDSDGQDPRTLTDGWRNGPGRTWHSPAAPQKPIELVYEFAKPVTVEAVQLHQDPDWPSKEVDVLVSADGQTFTPLWTATLPEKGVPNANFGFVLKRGLSAKASRLKVVIRSGYKPQHWGLGEVEVFGTGAVMRPDDDVNFVTTDIADLKPGTTLHYRLVAVSSAGTTLGPDRTFTVPTGKEPHVVTGGADRITATSARVEGRLNPLGKPCEFVFEYGTDKAFSQRSAVVYGGSMITPRTAAATLIGLKPGTTYQYRLAAIREGVTSRGEEATFKTR